MNAEMSVKPGDEILEKDQESEVQKTPEVVDSDDDEDDAKAENFENYQGTGRTVTLQMLLAAKMLEPGKSTMTIEYLGQKFVGDLLADGKIKSQETETIFCSPSAWAMHCKRIINPEKKSGCGWASVKYKGKKLDAYKAQWLRKCQLHKESTPSDDEIDGEPDKKEMSPVAIVKRVVLPHNTVSNRNVVHDANTLVESVSFASLNKIQPFLVSISTSSVLLMDFHCHLTKTEVCGYLGGSWDVNSHTLSITHAYPCRNSRHDRETAAQAELEIQRAMLKNGLTLVGWYHSHPRCAAQPTLRDCDAQLEYQIKMRGASEATYSPCIGLICAPYSPDNPTQESSIMAFWIVPPPENRIMEYGRPMLMTYSVTQDNELSKQIIDEMKACVAYYKKFKFDMVDFDAQFNEDTTYIEKLKVTLYSKFPRKQNDHEFWNFVREELGMEPESEFTPPRWASSPQPEPEPKEVTDEAGQDLTNKSESKQSKEDKLLIRTLQEQLSLPSGLNMNPSPISSTLLPNVTNSMSSNNSIQTSSSSPRDSPITIPSNSASPAKFVRASPSPVKSDTSSTRTRNSPAPSPHKYSVDRTDLTRSSPSANLHKYEQSLLPSTSTPSTQASLSDFYSANFSTLAKNLSNYSPSDYAMLFNSKDYGLSSLNQLAVSSAMTNTSSSNSSNKQQQSQSSSSSSAATATANNMKDFLAQLEKTTELSYLMQSQYNYPGISGASSKSSNDYHPPKSSTKHEKSKSSRSSSAQQQQQQQRQMEEDYKRDASNISEFMRSQEYASLLMEQAEALSKSYQLPEIPKKSKKSQQQQQHQQQHGPSAADLTSLLQASPKIHELNSLFQSGKQSSDLTSLLQQQLSAASSSASSSQKKNQSQQPDYSSLFAHSKMADLQSLMAGQSERDRHMTPSAADLSALFGSALGGKSSVDMLGSLLQSNKASDLSSLLFSQANAAELSNLFSQAVSSSSAKTAANTAAYYTQAAIDKAQQDMAALYQQHGKYSSIPDPLSKSTLAANNMFMNPSAVYAKMQQEALSAMIMKPPKVSSSSSTSSSKSREASASPALDKSHKNRDSPASLNKYNFSAADLAISAVSNVPNAMSSPIIPSTDHARKLNEFSQMDISMSEASQLESRLKKRMEFSSIADLVSTPSKMQKLEELANMHMQESESESAALNLSSND
ncbi:MPN domain-containing protein CG4751 isoform X2 [Bradysia coprophila]|uniref:MPN domain-containing protein CG4751 isoform X2 n=1 Tax=Bradysia coprophila TaxID=38358 RepID=UPI00187D9506|nr:MPN domain-containing protein CG4751 isoform X2 [Bradysia coprophila]